MFNLDTSLHQFRTKSYRRYLCTKIGFSVEIKYFNCKPSIQIDTIFFSFDLFIKKTKKKN